MNPVSRWSALVERRPWLARSMLVVCSLSLLATSPDDDDDYGTHGPRFTKSAPAPDCNLTAEDPVCEFQVSVRHDRPAPGEPFFTINARANVRGEISMSEVPGAAPFVAVRVGSEELNALTEFSLQHSLAFSGGCSEENAGAPCFDSFVISFSRTDLGEGGGTVNVNWRLALEGSALSHPDAGAGETLPWTVEYLAR